MPSSNSTSSTSNSPGRSPAIVPAPSAALLELLSPDGYYTYLNIPRQDFDDEFVKKNYRKLSLKHHPDRPDGDAETFRVLNRAQKVLQTPKLRQQYDLIGIDLEEEEDDSDEKDPNSSDDPQTPANTTPETMISHMASATLVTLLQVMVRTGMMGLTALVLVRFRLLLFPAIAFLVFVAYRVHSTPSATNTSNNMETLSPLMIGIGLVLMYRAGNTNNEWSIEFWMGEGLVLTMFVFNSLPQQRTHTIMMGIFGLAFIATFWLRGKAWRYGTILALELVTSILCALAFPIMELIVEHVMNEKLKKVGEKIRQHKERYEAYYSAVQNRPSS